MKRRKFIKLSTKSTTLLSGMGVLPLNSNILSGISNDNFLNRLNDITPQDIQSIFKSDDEAVMDLVKEVFQHCVLGKIYPPEEPLKREWIAPGGSYYGQWLWDTMFVLDLLSVLPDTKEVIRNVFQNYWDFQDRWNAVKPNYMHNMIPCAMRPGRNWIELDHQFSQIPILAWGVERVYNRNRDRILLNKSLKSLERFHEWYWRERDVTNVGLVGVGAYIDKERAELCRPGTPPEQHARWETYDKSCDLDELKLTYHPNRRTETEGPWYGNILVAGNSSYLIMAEQSLIRLAKEVGDEAMVARRKARVDKAIYAMRKYMWDETRGLFLSVYRDTLEKIPTETCGGWMPLAAGVPTKKMAAKMAATYQTSAWQTFLPIPTVSRKDKRWVSNRFWRGDVWPAVNYQLAGGLGKYGYNDLAADLADKTIANAIKNGISEHYDSMTGKPLGIKHLGMTCTVVTLMLDGLSHDYHMELQ